MNTEVVVPGTKKTIFEPGSPKQLLEGWLLHAHKERDRHDLAARRYDLVRIWLGGIAAVISAVVAASASILAAVPGDAELKVKIIVAIFSTLSAILIGLSTFLNLAERVEKHRSAGVRYKAIVWELERILSNTTVEDLTNTDPLIIEIQKQTKELAESAPVVSEIIRNRVEREWRGKGIIFVPTADKLH